MSRYKDVENYRKLFDEEYKKTRTLICEGETHLDNLAEGFSEASRVIDRMPTADVVEVRHGEWRIVDSDIGYVELECSLCRNKLLFNTDDGFTYCPNCGAKMDGERGEE